MAEERAFPHGSQEERIARLEARVAELEARLATADARSKRMAKITDGRLRSLGARSFATAHQVEDIVRSRIWRTLSGAGGVLLRLTGGAPPAPADPPDPDLDAAITREAYADWIAAMEWEPPDWSDCVLAALPRRPLVSIVMPVHDPSPAALGKAIRSVMAQSYPEWELCIADDASSPETRRVLESFAHPRIRVAWLPALRGISGASNAALALATGEFVGLLDHDDELARDAVLCSVESLLGAPEAPFVYSDEDKIDERGRFDPFFKPDWSPDLILAENYVCHFLVARRELLNNVGGFRSEFDGSQDYDLILRLARTGGTPVHVPRVLYHWRAEGPSAALDPNAKGYAHDAAQRAIAEYVATAAPGATVEGTQRTGRWRVRYPVKGDPLVGIVIPSGGKVDVLRDNLEALAAKTEYPHYEILIADNSKSDEVRRYVERWNAANSRKVRYDDQRNRPFNYSVINNAAARLCQTPLLLFLNDDTTVIAPGWLTALVEQIERPEVGAVGAKLLYPGGRIQHAGVVMGVYENCGHAFKGLDGSRSHYFDLSDVIRNVSAVTGACLMTKSSVFAEVGGFDEETFAVAFNDIDLCLRIGALGYRVIYTPHALLYHHEAFSKTREDLTPHPAEVAAMRRKWARVIEHDPFYSPNLTRTREDYSLDSYRG